MPALRISGGLPAGGGGASMLAGLGGDPRATLSGLGASYASAYTDALNQNRASYDNILSGYQQAAATQRQREDAIGGGYNFLTNAVLTGLQGAGASQRQAITDQYRAAQGSQLQGAISRGLGNSTVLSSLQRGLTFDESKARNDLSDQLANRMAAYNTQLGLADLGYQGAAANADTALAGRQLDWMNSVTSAYPDAGAYAALAHQYGQAYQNDLDRAMAQRQLGPPPGTAGGYVPSGGGFPPTHQGSTYGVGSPGNPGAVVPWNAYGAGSPYAGTSFAPAYGYGSGPAAAAKGVAPTGDYLPQYKGLEGYGGLPGESKGYGAGHGVPPGYGRGDPSGVLGGGGTLGSGWTDTGGGYSMDPEGYLYYG